MEQVPRKTSTPSARKYCSMFVTSPGKRGVAEQVIAVDEDNGRAGVCWGLGRSNGNGKKEGEETAHYEVGCASLGFISVSIRMAQPQP